MTYSHSGIIVHRRLLNCLHKSIVVYLSLSMLCAMASPRSALGLMVDAIPQGAV